MTALKRCADGIALCCLLYTENALKLKRLSFKKYGKNLTPNKEAILNPCFFAQLPKPIVLKIINEVVGRNLSRNYQKQYESSHSLKNKLFYRH